MRLRSKPVRQIDHFIGAFNIGPSPVFDGALKERLGACLIPSNGQSTPIDNHALVMKDSGKAVFSRLEDNVFIAYLGDIFGYLKPIPEGYRADDAPAIMGHLYQRYGDDFARHINGHFIIVLWDENHQKLLLIQDKFAGIKTLYWSRRRDILFFSNYIKPLLALHPDTVGNMNPQALYQFLGYSRICPPDTIFKDVHQVAAGEMMAVRRGRMTRRLYDPWAFSTEPRITDKEEALATYQDLLAESIQSIKDLHPPCGFLSSGGLDSGVVVAIGAEQVQTPLKTVCVSADGYNTDAPYARLISQLCETDHSEYLVDGSEIDALPQIVWQMENPHYEPGTILVHSAHRCANHYMQSIIGGDVADQVFGYTCAAMALRRYRKNKNTLGGHRFFQRAVRTLCRNSIVDGIPVFSKLENKLIGKYDLNQWAGKFGFRHCDIKRMLRNNFPVEERYDNFAVPEKTFHELVEYASTTVVKDYALYGILFRNGRIGDMAGLKCFSPFIDKRVFNFVMSLDHSLRTPPHDSYPGQFDTKYLHKALAASMFPRRIMNRPKQGGAVHPSIHLADERRMQSIQNTILNSDFLNDLFDMAYVKNLFASPKRTALQIMMLLALDLWHHIFSTGEILTQPAFTLDSYMNRQ